MKNPRIEKAYNAMKALGISRDIFKPKLKHLYKLYDKNWSFIEAENYRALLDAIFEEDQKVEMKRKKPLNLDAHHLQLKKLHTDSEEDDASSTMDSSGLQVVLKEGDASISLSGGIAEASGSHLVSVKTEFGSCSAMDKGKGLLSSAAISDSGKITSERASCSGPKVLADVSVSLPVKLEKLPGYNHTKEVIVLDDDEQCNIDLMPLSGSTSKSLALPDLVEASSTGNISAKLSRCADLGAIKECASASNIQNMCKLDIVSSSSGDMKLCCVSASGKEFSCTLNADGIMKAVEEKFLRTHNVVGAPFSLKNLLEDLCNSCLESTDETANKSLVRTTSPEELSEDRMKLDQVEALENVGISGKRKSEPGSSQIVQEGRIRRPGLFIDDIAKGGEAVQISLVDEHGNSQPPEFFYIHKSIIYQKAIVNISLARISEEDCCYSCSGDCLSSSVPCACTRTTYGEFAYTTDGLLKSEFVRACLSDNRPAVYCQDCPIERAKNPQKPASCKGHAVRKFIKECWSKCGCNMQCGNRVVQRGITRKLQVFWTDDGKGWGLRALEDLPKGAFVCEYVGEIVTNTELDDRNKLSKGNRRHTYPIHLDADWSSESILDDDFALCLDATNYGNVARFINHKCGNANLLDIPVEVETVDHHYYHVAFFTTHEVKAYEELTWDYGIDFDDQDHPIKAFRCRCGSPHCRDRGRKGSRSKSKASGRY